VDGRLAVAAFFGVFYAAIVTYCVLKRRWWRASGTLAIGIVMVLGAATEGNHSRPEHNIVFAVSLLLLAWFLVTLIKAQRSRLSRAALASGHDGQQRRRARP